MKLTRNARWLGAIAAWMLGCGSSTDDGASVGTGTSTGTGQMQTAKSVSLQVDANRDGYVDDNDDKVDKTVWDKTHGAAFLANLDDDDSDHKRDCDDEVVNGDADSYDLGRILARPFADAPSGVKGSIAVSAECIVEKKATPGQTTVVPCDPTPFVRMFRLGGNGGWTVVTLPSMDPSIALSEDDVVNGAQFGIEGKTLVALPEASLPLAMDETRHEWNGVINLTYKVLGADGKTVSTPTSPDGTDRAKIHVAPWMMFGNLTPHLDLVYAGNESPIFQQGLKAAIAEANKVKPIGFYNVNNWPGDQWVEDFFQTGMQSVPWGKTMDGKDQVAGMRISMPRPWGRDNKTTSLPVNWLIKAHLSPDVGYFVVYKKPNSGSSFDSHGNHDWLPPYSNNGQSFPYGRIVHGSGILPETHHFYEAQLVQGPPMVLKTDWLLVGHVDEVFSYVPAATPRGWKLLVGSPKLAKSMLEDLQKKGFGQTKMFVGKKWQGGASAEISIDDTLADQDLMKWSQTAQTHIDPMVAQAKMEIGLTDDEIIYLPTLFEAQVEAGNEYSIAWQPGVVNMRSFTGFAVIPDPFGPQVDGKDVFKQDLIDRLSTDVNKLGYDGKGLKVYFADDWDWYHALDGEVHCGSNQEGAPQVEWKWWERMQ